MVDRVRGAVLALDLPTALRLVLAALVVLLFAVTAKADGWSAEGRSGVALSVAGRQDPAILGVQAQGLIHPTAWSSFHFGVAFLASPDFDEEIHAGFPFGLQFQPPWRIAPFVGVGFFLGYDEVESFLDYLFADDEDDLFPDPTPERRTEASFFRAVYPEAGLHVLDHRVDPPERLGERLRDHRGPGRRLPRLRGGSRLRPLSAGVGRSPVAP